MCSEALDSGSDLETHSVKVKFSYGSPGKARTGGWCREEIIEVA